MLKPQDNELLCRVGPGTPMGSYMRQFWVPALRSERVKPGDAPIKLRLLGEDFVVFRTLDGRLACYDEPCPHRGTSLAMAANEGDGLRCAYHGWKLDPDGKVLDMPCEPAACRAQQIAGIQLDHHPVREAGKVIWVYIGRKQTPEFPWFNFFDLPSDYIEAAVGVIHCNWFQGLEGQLDSAHVGILHKDWMSGTIQSVIAYDSGPRFEFEPEPYGFREAAVRRAPGGKRYVRVRDFVVPWYSFIPIGGRDDDHDMTISVPIDDEHSAQWDVVYNFVRPLIPGRNFADYSDRDNISQGVSTVGQRFGQSRRRMKEGSFTGFSQLRDEDFAVAMSQGAILDRSREYLGMSDSSISRARRLLLDAARRFARGEPAFGASPGIGWEEICAENAVIEPDADWRAVAR